MSNISRCMMSLHQEKNPISSEKVRNQYAFGNSEVVKKIIKLKNMADELIFPPVWIFSLHLHVLGLIFLQSL